MKNPLDEFVRLALVGAGGSMKAAAEKLRWSYGELLEHIARTPHMREYLADIREGLADDSEKTLEAAIDQACPWAIKYTLKTLGAKRGYANKPEAGSLLVDPESNTVNPTDSVGPTREQGNDPVSPTDSVNPTREQRNDPVSPTREQGNDDSSFRGAKGDDIERLLNGNTEDQFAATLTEVKGNLSRAAGKFKMPRLDVKKIVAARPRLQAIIEEARERLLDKAEIAPAWSGRAGKQVVRRAHSVNLSKDNRFAIVADAGIDQIFVYKLDADKGTLSPNDPPYLEMARGAGPRHFAFHPTAPLAFVINESASALSSLSYDADKGTFKMLKTVSTLPNDYKDAKKRNSTAELVVHPNGKFVYGLNRGHDSVVAFKLDEKTGDLGLIGYATEGIKEPRNFNIDPTGQYMLVGSQLADKIVVFKIDRDTGALKSTGESVDVGTPICIRFLPIAK